MPTVTEFCPSCGGKVTCEVRIVRNRKLTICTNCRFQIGEKILAVSEAPPDALQPVAPAVPAAAPAAAEAGPRTLGTVLSAEDTPAIRNALQAALIEKQIAKTVVSTENGFEALVAFHKAVRQGARLDLLVLDVNMPILDGINLAVCIRAVEKANGLPPHPILFFTSNLCDEPFRRALAYLSPARYINKGAGNTGMEFGERLATVLRGFLGGASA